MYTIKDFNRELKHWSVLAEGPPRGNYFKRSSDNNWIIRNLAVFYQIKGIFNKNKSSLIDEIIIEETKRRYFTSSIESERNSEKSDNQNNNIIRKIPFTQFATELRDWNVLFDSIHPTNRYKRPTDNRWIISDLAELYGINLSKIYEKSTAINQILIAEMEKGYFTYPDNSYNPLPEENNEFSVKINNEEKQFQPYSVTIDVKTENFHKEFLNLLYQSNQLNNRISSTMQSNDKSLIQKFLIRLESKIRYMNNE